MRRHRHAKILATLGPATSDAEMIEKLFNAGADVFRLNFSHGSHDDHRRRFEAIRALEARTFRPIGILMDLQGPKFRVGKFADGRVDLTPGGRFRLDLDQSPGDGRRVNLPHPEILQALDKGAELLLNDGNIRLRVTERADDYAETEIEVGGRLSDHKGVNVRATVRALLSNVEAGGTKVRLYAGRVVRGALSGTRIIMKAYPQVRSAQL